jgi:hypothetical protein
MKSSSSLRNTSSVLHQKKLTRTPVAKSLEMHAYHFNPRYPLLTVRAIVAQHQFIAAQSITVSLPSYRSLCDQIPIAPRID